MDFNLTEEQQAVNDLGAKIFSDQLTRERFKEVEASDERCDRQLWTELAKAGLLAISLPEEYGGSDQGFLATAMLLEQAGRHAAPVPLLATVVMGALPIAKFADASQRDRLLPAVATGELIMTAALFEPGTAAAAPGTTARAEGDGWRIDGSKTCVPYGAIADVFLVPAATGPHSVGVFVVDRDTAGVTVTALATTTGEPDAKVDFEGVLVGSDAVIGSATDGAEIVDWITTHSTAGICSVLAGACKEAVNLTAEYAKSREQFDRPIATFQAVSQRTADAYIDAESIALTSRQAAWRLSEGLPASDEVAIAKFFAAEAGQRVVHAAQHIHGGTGVDRDYPLHRYFLLAKQLELTLGGSTANLLKLGGRLAAEPATV